MNKLLFFASIAASSISSYAGLVFNGDFESPPMQNPSWDGTLQSIPGWTLDYGTGIEIQNHAAGISPYAGQQIVELDSYNNSGMRSDSITTINNVQYDLSFAFSPRPEVTPESNIIIVYFNDNEIGRVTGDGTKLVDSQWEIKHFVVRAPGTASTIGFRAAGVEDGRGGLIDNVCFSAVPEPSTWFAGLSAIGMLALVGWRNWK